jgi:hypothetical protein
MIDRNRGALTRWRGRACGSTQGVEDPWQGRERVFESNGVFSSLIKEAMGFGKDGSRGRDPTPALGPAEVADPARQRGRAPRRSPRAFYEIVSKPLELVLFPTMHMYSSCIFVHVAWFCSF